MTPGRMRTRGSRSRSGFTPMPSAMGGFNLIEVLVALLVTAMGLAGVAALLLNGVSTSHGAGLSSVAVTHAQTGVEMMRANLNAYTDGWYDGTNTSGAAPAPATCTGTCTPAEQAGNDFSTWRARLAASMPGGLGYICTDSTPDDGQPGALDCDGNGYNTIKIFWHDGHDDETLAAGENYHRFATAVNP